ncbi:MAG: zf-HC2 domain-containing protein [Candidatus Latescibacteria bacterium]|jgi:anti-sigma factor RsiW|nr:zf-HC2 domain-containing protein [Candidatus Latescibacterota bacterium]MBT4136687.1 zf-HC2 domain-containing protein [Candidatus Latescibacterota bacterium]
MTYEAFEEKISAYLDDELSPIARTEMERKAAECEDCRVLLKDMKALKERLTRLPQAQPSAGFNFELRSHLLMAVAKENQMSHRVRRVFFGSTMRTITTLAAAVILGLGLTNVVQDQISSIPVVQATAEDADFLLTPAQPASAIDHRGALERLSQQSRRLDGKLYRNSQDSGRVDTMLNRQKRMSPWLKSQDVKQIPVSF